MAEISDAMKCKLMNSTFCGGKKKQRDGEHSIQFMSTIFHEKKMEKPFDCILCLLSFQVKI